ncbi:hypothetical protein GCM10027416_23190 [Okibacterium endophyticum]
MWIGTFRGSDDDWADYFDVDRLGAACGFCRDTRVDWFDLDRFSAYNAGAVLPIEDVVIEVPYSEQFEHELLGACRAFGIGEASHCFAFIDFEGEVAPGGAYLGLTSVGTFGFRA